MLKKYRMMINGIETVLKLADEDLHAYPNAVPVEAKQDKAPAAKARKPANKARTPKDK